MRADGEGRERLYWTVVVVIQGCGGGVLSGGGRVGEREEVNVEVGRGGRPAEPQQRAGMAHLSLLMIWGSLGA